MRLSSLTYWSLLLLLLTLLGNCDDAPAPASMSTDILSLELVGLDDVAYPDNPDIGFRAEDYDADWFTGGSLVALDSQYFDMVFYAKDGDTLALKRLPLHTWLPLLPARLRGDAYLSQLSLINQEWNRNQVAFHEGEFETTTTKVVRIDLARNCLQSYLWEVIVYTQEGDHQLPFAHGWFNFPQSLYDRLFEENNGLAFDSMSHCLAHWEDPTTAFIQRELLRKVIEEHAIAYTDSSDLMYPLGGARTKKFKEIIVPAVFNTMRDLQTDSTQFATFTPPGFYNRADPRTTELGRFVHLDTAYWRTVSVLGNEGTFKEIELVFFDRARARQTHFVLGGWTADELPILAPAQANSGWKHSMGFGNHTFYEEYDVHCALHREENPHYAYLTNADHEWLDSHRLGIDGPILHWDAQGQLHLWLLSFERHALVGHYVLNAKAEDE